MDLAIVLFIFLIAPSVFILVVGFIRFLMTILPICFEFTIELYTAFWNLLVAIVDQAIGMLKEIKRGLMK